MISIDEINSTVKRLELLKNNTSDAMYAFMAMNLIINIKQLVAQLEAAAKSPEFQKQAL